MIAAKYESEIFLENTRTGLGAFMVQAELYLSHGIQNWAVVPGVPRHVVVLTRTDLALIVGVVATERPYLALVEDEGKESFFGWHGC